MWSDTSRCHPTIALKFIICRWYCMDERGSRNSIEILSEGYRKSFQVPLDFHRSSTQALSDYPSTVHTLIIFLGFSDNFGRSLLFLGSHRLLMTLIDVHRFSLETWQLPLVYPMSSDTSSEWSGDVIIVVHDNTDLRMCFNHAMLHIHMLMAERSKKMTSWSACHPARGGKILSEEKWLQH